MTAGGRRVRGTWEVGTTSSSEIGRLYGLGERVDGPLGLGERASAWKECSLTVWRGEGVGDTEEGVGVVGGGR